MRFGARMLLSTIAALALSAPAAAQQPDDQILPQSVELQAKGRAALAAGRLGEAEDMFESALAADPRNRFAYVDIARVAERQKLFGKAVRMTGKALAIDPNDRSAIAVQGEAMVELGAVARAQDNLAKLRQLCVSGCPEVAELQSAISRGATVAAAKPPADEPKKN